MALFLLLVVCGGAALFASQERPGGEAKARSLVASLLGLTLGTGFVILFAGQLAAAAAPDAFTTAGVLTTADGLVGVYRCYALGLLLPLLVLGSSIQAGARPAGLGWARPIAAILLPALAAAVAWFGLWRVEADIVFKRAELSENDGRLDLALALYERAARLDPTSDLIWASAGRAARARADQRSSTSQDTNLAERAERHFTTAERLAPYDANHWIDRARRALLQASDNRDRAEEQRRLTEAVQAYARASRLAPGDPVVEEEQRRARALLAGAATRPGP